MAVPQILVNGKNYDWGDIALTMFGGLITQITKINYSEKRASVNNYGYGNFPTSYGNKNFEFTGSISMYIDQLKLIQDAAPFNSILRIPPFSIKIVMSGDGVAYRTIKLSNVRFTENNFDISQGDSSIVVPVPITFAGIS